MNDFRRAGSFIAMAMTIMSAIAIVMTMVSAIAIAVTTGMIGSAVPALAQATCTTRNVEPPPRVVLECGGIVIEREAAAVMGVPLPDINAGVVTVSLDGGAALVNVPPGRGGFQIRTPHAIASVRGTTWAVDVTAARTSVFVLEGTVSVRRTREDGEAVTLGAGEGVDVAAAPGVAGTERPGDREPLPALTVQRWGAARVAALLARFGR